MPKYLVRGTQCSTVEIEVEAIDICEAERKAVEIDPNDWWHIDSEPVWVEEVLSIGETQ